jgi:predicted ATPase
MNDYRRRVQELEEEYYAEVEAERERLFGHTWRRTNKKEARTNTRA